METRPLLFHYYQIKIRVSGKTVTKRKGNRQ